MRVLLLNQFFWPDSSATSQLLTDLARALAADGHDVTAISSDAGGYAVTGQTADAPEVRNLRVRALPFGRGRVGRLLSYLSFYVSAALRGLTLPRQDVVLTLTTPPLLPVLGTLIKKVRGARHVIWEMDMYPDVATDLGYFSRGGMVDRVVGLLADTSRRYADRTIALGECMRDRLLARGVPAARITVADNWADGRAIVPLARIGGGKELVLLYSGNLGLAHDIETISAAMVSLKEDRRFRFLFVGSGGRRAALAATIAEHGLDQVELRPYVARASLSESLAIGDIGLVTQRDECCGSVVPSKVYGLLAAGRAVLFIGPAAATPARLIARFGCGWHVPVGESQRLVQLLDHLADHPEEVALAGRRARQALVEHFDLSHGVRRIVAVLEDVCHGPKQTRAQRDTADGPVPFDRVQETSSPAPTASDFTSTSADLSGELRSAADHFIQRGKTQPCTHS